MYKFIALFFMLAALGCATPSKDADQIKDDVAKLNSELKVSNADFRKRLAGAESELKALKTKYGRDMEAVKKGVKRSGADSSAELDAMRADFQQLTGNIEEIRHLSEKTTNQNSVFIETAEARMKSLEDKIAQLEKMLSEISYEITSLKAKLTEPKENKGPAAAKLSANEIYKAGLDFTRNGKPKEARAMFRKYLKGYPKGPLANNAQFWIGESYYDEKDFERAIIEFDEVIKKYPKGIKVPAAMLKQAMSFEKIKDNKTAQAIYGKLIKKYPGTDEAKTARKMMKKAVKKKKK